MRRLPVRALVLVVLLVGFLAYMALAEPSFYSLRNLSNIGRQMSRNAILAAGMTLVILTAGIDLSVGSVLAFSGVLTGIVIKAGCPVPLAVLVGLLVGAGLGGLNGVLVSVARLPPFVVTLAMMVMARSGTRVVTSNRAVYELPESLAVLGRGYLVLFPEPFRISVPVPVLLILGIYVICYLLLYHFRLGRYIYAVGGNEDAAHLAGVNTTAVKIWVYVISGFLAAMAGCIEISRALTADPTIGLMYELDAIAAVVVGGTSLMGGRGHILGTLFGALLISMLDNAMDLLNINDDYQGLVTGAVIIGAVLASRRKP